MAYSTVTQFRDNVPVVTTSVLPDANVDTRIESADKKIRSDLGGVIDFSLVTDTPVGCPEYINILSQYKTAELSLVAAYSRKRAGEEQDDIEYWMKNYNELRDDILAGAIDLGAVAVAGFTYSKDARDGVVPALGQGEYGEYLDDEDLNEKREEYGGTLDD